MEMIPVYKNRAPDGSNNLCGKKVRRFRVALAASQSQRAFADMLQLEGLGLDKNAVQRLESGQRMIPPRVLCALADFYQVSVDYILERTDQR